MTYFRGDRTRPVEIVKVDVEYNDDETTDSKKETVTSVTNIWTVDATLLDSGAGMDAADVYAHGPGRLETRPDHDQPVERIAIWQDTLIVKNKLGPNNELLHKVIDLTGNRPCFIDNLQKTSIDSASWIQVWLKPKPASPKAADERFHGHSQRYRSTSQTGSGLHGRRQRESACSLINGSPIDSTARRKIQRPRPRAAAFRWSNCMRSSTFICLPRPRR